MNRLLVAAGTVTMLGGCAGAPSPGTAASVPVAHSSSAGPFALTVMNLDGPQANVLIGDRKVATLNCWDRPVTLTPGDAGLPALPWTVTILDISHSPTLKTLGTRTETSTAAPETIVIRADHLDSGPNVSPDASPIASCPPAPSAEPLD